MRWDSHNRCPNVTLAVDLCEKTASRRQDARFRREGRLWQHIQPWPADGACTTGNSTSLLLAGAALAACTSSDGGGGASPSGGQSPDPVVLDFPIAYVKRPVPTDTAMSPDARELLPFQPGADLYLRDRAAPSAAERNLTAEITKGMGDVRDVEPSYDGRKLVFALREPNIVGAAPEDQPTWNIWEYDLDLQQLRRVIASDTTADDGQDVAPHYLPDGRIVFSSTRQRQSKAILLDEGKPQFEAQDESDEEPAFVLHVMNADGSGLHQVSFNQSHDLDPAVLPDGRVVFSRWDNAAGHDEISLYTMRPDGSDLQLLYGARSHDTGTDGEEIHFLDPRPMASGKLLVLAQPFQAPDLGGQLLEVDTANYVELAQPTLPNRGVLAGPAQVAATSNDVRTVDGPVAGRALQLGVSIAGRHRPHAADVEPVPPAGAGHRRHREDRAVHARPAGGRRDGARPPRSMACGSTTRRSRRSCRCRRPSKARSIPTSSHCSRAPCRRCCSIASPASITTPNSRPKASASSTSAASTTSRARTSRRAALRCCAIQHVTLAAARPARFVRIEKPVSMPDDDVRDFDGSAFGVTSAFGMREILGYAPVEPDGSVRVKVPADVAFALTVLDANGRRIGARHDNWLQVRAGQELKCNGCHAPVGDDSHGRDNLFAAANAGAPGTGVPFPNTNPAYFADFGETMAQVRARISCQTDCADLLPATAIRYEDVWTDPVAAGRAPDAAFAYDYLDLETAAPTSSDCVTALACGLPDHDPLRAPPPSVVEQAARDARRRRHRAAGRHLRRMPFGARRRRHDPRSGSATRTDGRAVRRRAHAVPRLPRTAGHRCRAGGRQRRAGRTAWCRPASIR